MTEDDKADFVDLVSDVMAFYRQDVSQFAISVWWQACQGFSLEQVRKALTGHAMDPERGQFPPKPADLIRQLQGTATDRAIAAWGKALEAARSVGAWQSVAFDDPVIHAVITDLGGWPKFCRSEADDLPHVQRRFTEAYRVYAERGSQGFTPVLAGDSELRNGDRFGRPKPVLIGNKEAAQRVIEAGRAGLPVSVGAAIRSQPKLRVIANTEAK